MKYFILFLGGFWGICTASIAQVELASNRYFPVDFESPELPKIISEEAFEDSARLSKIEGGRLIADVGFEKYIQRKYSTTDSGALTIEATTLKDFRAAYSLLTLLSSSSIQKGPPGDVFTAAADGIRFTQGRYWIRIQGKSASEDFVRRVAISISNRIGPCQPTPPSLVSHFPKSGYDAFSLKYFPNLESFESYSGSIAARSLHINSDVEIAQARYIIDNQPGLMSLLKFPTIQVAEEYFGNLAGSESSAKNENKAYAKRAGPIVAILKGPFTPGSADKILGFLRYRYSVRWIFEKHNKPSIIWGIPVSILGTVVKSLFFVTLLCGISVIAGVCFAVLRFTIRNHLSRNAPDHPERTEIIRLRLR